MINTLITENKLQDYQYMYILYLYIIRRYSIVVVTNIMFINNILFVLLQNLPFGYTKNPSLRHCIIIYTLYDSKIRVTRTPQINNKISLLRYDTKTRIKTLHYNCII